MSCLISVTSVALFLQVTHTHANMRPPITVHNGPSSSLRAPAEGLVVQEEFLRFDFVESIATVTAEYKIHCKQPGERLFEFVLPAQLGLENLKNRLMRPAELEITAEVNRIPVEVDPVQPINTQQDFEQELADFIQSRIKGMADRDANYTSNVIQRVMAELADRMYVAQFTGDLRPGENILRVTYQQPLAREEFGHSKLRNGRFADTLVYELSPLQGWPLADDFQIRMELTTSKSGWWSTFRGRSNKLMLCGPEGKKLESTVQHENGRQLLKAVFNHDFPARVKAYYGNADIVARAFNHPKSRYEHETTDFIAAFLARDW